MQEQLLLLSIIIGIAIFLIIISIAAIIYQNRIKYTRAYRENPDEWFFYKFSIKLYNALFGITEPEDIALKLGIDVKDYYDDCRVIGEEANIKGIIIDYIYSFISIILGVVFGIIFNPLFVMVGLMMALYFIKYKRSKAKAEAEEARNQIKAEFPRFLGLLYTELEIGLPIEIAIELLSSKYDSLLSKEFLNSLNDVKLGAINWHQALIQISEKYKIDDLSDFVLDITTAFSKGTSIAEAVGRRAKEMKNERLYEVKERAAKAENTMLLPIAILQFIPMMAFILLPTITAVSVLG